MSSERRRRRVRVAIRGRQRSRPHDRGPVEETKTTTSTEQPLSFRLTRYAKRIAEADAAELARLAAGLEAIINDPDAPKVARLHALLVRVAVHGAERGEDPGELLAVGDDLLYAGRHWPELVGEALRMARQRRVAGRKGR